MRIQVASSSVAAVDPLLFGGFGDARACAGRQETLLSVVSGTDAASGAEVLALLDELPPPQGECVSARSMACFPKPRRMSHGASAQLPFIALTAAAALHTVGLPPGSASIGSNSALPATVVVAGSSGRLPGLLVQLIAARGARAWVAAQRDAVGRLRELGAAEVVDHDCESFSMVYGGRRSTPLDAVLDCVGAEQESNSIHQALGSVYVSVASPALRSLEEEGAFALAKARWAAVCGKPADQVARRGRVWTAGALAAEALTEVLELIEDGAVAPPAEANLMAETAAQFLEFLTWARDTETGGRYGFPGPSMWDEGAAEGGSRPVEKGWTTIAGTQFEWPSDPAAAGSSGAKEQGPNRTQKADEEEEKRDPS